MIPICKRSDSILKRNLKDSTKKLLAIINCFSRIQNQHTNISTFLVYQQCSGRERN
jgi:hypothetical protein